MAQGPYSRLYHSLMDEYPAVWANPTLLGTYAQLLVMAEKFYPQRPPIPPRKAPYLALVEAGLVLEDIGRGTFTMRGLASERDKRGNAARIAADVRWHPKGNAKTMPRRDEKEKETRQGNGTAANGAPLLMGFRPKPTVDKEEERRTIERMQRETDDELYRRHPELRRA